MEKRLFFIAFLLANTLAAQPITIPLQPGEKLWSGEVSEGHLMPFPTSYQFNFFANNRGNQAQPLLLSNRGLYVWSEEPYAFAIQNDRLIITKNLAEVIYGRTGETLAAARSYAAAHFFPPSGTLPDTLLFARPQYNTWIELTYHQNQQDILKYARAILDNDLPPGVLMIDDTWQEDYGLWRFHPGRFPNPTMMMDSLHAMGFKVMLWVCPFVSADQARIVHELTPKKAFLMQKEDENTTWATARKPAMITWWNGTSALLDLTNPVAVNWFHEQLDQLVHNYGVDGFKLDAGDMPFYPPEALSKEKVSPNEQCRRYAEVGLSYPLNEYRACWKMAGQPLVQRLRDKNHSWHDLQMLIPDMLVESLAGYTFSCPDMIGGGEYLSFENLSSYDQDLVVRSAQCHALMPMMQFSVAPWRILDSTHLAVIRQAVALRMRFTPRILSLAHQSASSGTPIIGPLDYYFPGQGFEYIHDEFMLGENLLVAPMVAKGTKRKITLPKGSWRDDTGKKYKGGRQYEISVPLERLPFFEKLK